MENQNDRHHTIDITGYAEDRPSIPSAETSSRGSKCQRVWVIFQITVCVCQITVSIVTLWWSKAHESPDRVRVVWVEGYICACLLLLPLICFTYRTVHGATMNRLYVLVEVLKMAMGFFFAVWFVLGSISISGSSSNAKKLDMLCQVLLRSGCIVYAIPSIGCFFLPHMISSSLAPANPTGTATAELFKPLPARVSSFNALPTYRFKLKETGAGAICVLAAGTEQERVLSEDDAACCICLGKYAENDELRELPCSHFFHKECVDEWLKINPRCPLCQSQLISRSHGASTFPNGSGQNPSEMPVGGDTHGRTVS